VRSVFILHGINDIIHPERNSSNPFRPITDLPTAKELIEGLQFYLDQAHAHGIRVYLSPILPFKGWRTYNEEKDEIRLAVNDWIRNRAAVEGILPLSDAVEDPTDPLVMAPPFDSGDHLHPSAAGAKAMADAIPSEQI
jgi:lysophospholipase L1-like esterase